MAPPTPPQEVVVHQPPERAEADVFSANGGASEEKLAAGGDGSDECHRESLLEQEQENLQANEALAVAKGKATMVSLEAAASGPSQKNLRSQQAKQTVRCADAGPP